MYLWGLLVFLLLNSFHLSTTSYDSQTVFPKLSTWRFQRDKSTIKHYVEIHDWLLELEENQSLKAPLGECKFYQGHIYNADPSYAIITECNTTYYGLINYNKTDYIIEPISDTNRTHVLRKRDIDLNDKITVYNLNYDSETDVSFDFNETDEFKNKYDITQNDGWMEVENLIELPPIMKSENGLWLELIVLADYTVVNFHGITRVRHYILALMNIVSAIYNHPSLDANMTIVITKLYLNEVKDNVLVPGDVKKSLSAVNKWNYRLHSKLSPDRESWDAAIWLTKADLGGTAGYAPLGGVCTSYRSATVSRDEGLTSAFVIAHELGHILGLNHDDDEKCTGEASVMAGFVLATLYKYSWSQCSKEEFFRNTRNYYCMQRRSKSDGVILGTSSSSGGYTFTLDEQCRSEFGDGYRHSQRSRLKCARLRCYHESNALIFHTKRQPPLEGTPCGTSKWCVDGHCKLISKHLTQYKFNNNTSKSNNDISEHYTNASYTSSNENIDIIKNVEWNDWSNWTRCDVICGYGIIKRNRTCNVSSARYLDWCNQMQVKTCWSGKQCTTYIRDVRYDICRTNKSTLIPYIMDDVSDWCNAWCIDINGGKTLQFGPLPDGTPCSYEQKYNLCYQGACMHGECDSSDKECNGCTRNECKNTTSNYVTKLRNGWTLLAVIPHLAKSVRISVQSNVTVKLALKERGKLKYELKNHLIDIKHSNDVPLEMSFHFDDQVGGENHILDVRGKLVAAGALIKWIEQNDEVKFTIDGTLKADLMLVALKNYSEEGEMKISLNFTTNLPSSQNIIVWNHDACSVSCGKGIRILSPTCNDGLTSKCPSDMPSVRYEACDMGTCDHTDGVWWNDEWEPCSATCGNDGVQTRRTLCIPNNIRTNDVDYILSELLPPTHCNISMQPETIQPCNRLSCPVHWIELDWTPCSATCGRGVSSKPLYCPSNIYDCGTKPKERWKHCRIRKCRKNKVGEYTLTYSCPKRDSHIFCALEIFNRSCDLPPFRKLCCEFCKIYDKNKMRMTLL